MRRKQMFFFRNGLELVHLPHWKIPHQVGKAKTLVGLTLQHLQRQLDDLLYGSIRFGFQDAGYGFLRRSLREA